VIIIAAPISLKRKQERWYPGESMKGQEILPRYVRGTGIGSARAVSERKRPSGSASQQKVTNGGKTPESQKPRDEKPSH
jgi:hypothetical protein